MAVCPLQKALFDDLSMLELTYRFLTLLDDHLNSYVTCRKRFFFIFLHFLREINFYYDDFLRVIPKSI